MFAKNSLSSTDLASTLSGSVDHALRLWTLPLPCFGQIRTGASLCFWFVICRTGKGRKWDKSGTNAMQSNLSTSVNAKAKSTAITLMQSKCAEAATPKRWVQTFWPFQPCGLCNLSLHPLYPCFCSSMFIRWICSKMSLTCFHPMKQAESLLRKTDDVGHWIRARWENENQWCCVDLGAASRKMPTVAQDVLRLPHTTYTTYTTYTTSSWLHHDVSSHVILLCCLCCFGPCFIWFNTFCRRRAESA